MVLCSGPLISRRGANCEDSYLYKLPILALAVRNSVLKLRSWCLLAFGVTRFRNPSIAL